MRTVSALLLGALLLAGCSNPPPAADPETPSVFEEGPADLAGQTVLKMALDRRVETTVWANGSVAAQDTCNTGACVLDASRAMHITDITGDVPAGVPVELTVTMEAQPSPFFGTFEVYVEAPDSVYYWYRQETDQAGGSNLVQTLLRPSGTVSVVLFANAPGGGNAETPYTLSIAIVADPERISPGAPMGVELGPGANLTLRAPGQERPPFLLYGPNDALLGTFEGNTTLPSSAAKGEYAVLLPNGSQWGNLSTDSGAQTMRALGLASVVGPEGALPPTGTYDADWDVQGFPLAVGLHAYGAQTPIGCCMASNGFTIRMEGPGVALESGELCEFCLTGGFGFTVGSGTGNPDVTAGTYSLHAETQATYELRIMPFALYLART